MLPLIKGYCSEKVYELLGAVAAVLRRLGLPARTIRSSSTSAIRRSTRSTRARRTSRRSTCSSARSARDGGATLQGLLGRRSGQTIESDEGGDALAAERAALAEALATAGGDPRRADGEARRVALPRGPAGQPGAASRSPSWSSAGCWCVTRRWRWSAQGEPRRQGLLRGQARVGALVLPRGAARHRPRGTLVEQSTLDLMEVPEEAF